MRIVSGLGLRGLDRGLDGVVVAWGNLHPAETDLDRDLHLLGDLVAALFTKLRRDFGDLFSADGSMPMVRVSFMLISVPVLRNPKPSDGRSSPATAGFTRPSTMGTSRVYG